MGLRKFIATTIHEYLNEQAESTDNDLKILDDFASDKCKLYDSAGQVLKVGRNGKKIQKVASNPASTEKGITNWIKKLGIDYNVDYAKTTSSRYITFEKEGVSYKIRCATHTPAMEDFSDFSNVDISIINDDEIYVYFDTTAGWGYKLIDIKQDIEYLEKYATTIIKNPQLNPTAVFNNMNHWVERYVYDDFITNFLNTNNIPNVLVLRRVVRSYCVILTLTDKFKDLQNKREEKARAEQYLNIPQFKASNGLIIKTKNKKFRGSWEIDFSEYPEKITGKENRRKRHRLEDEAIEEFKKFLNNGLNGIPQTIIVDGNQKETNLNN
jgi:hypothetical protein